jgi:hypothetical protein
VGKWKIHHARTHATGLPVRQLPAKNGDGCVLGVRYEMVEFCIFGCIWLYRKVVAFGSGSFVALLVVGWALVVGL